MRNGDCPIIWGYSISKIYNYPISNASFLKTALSIDPIQPSVSKDTAQLIHSDVGHKESNKFIQLELLYAWI
ncbi:hypothetical protein AYI68_g7375 [Smittium mucronatum]|uniref:Uncharacterized protein n=1 Tax=Smittium mucronatum TaxID=133383 RepID=A0A1R0GNU6_9FUNG|nr:hypothetical protein AYI68_g7375 [Smittium mucronatum]